MTGTAISPLLRSSAMPSSNARSLTARRWICDMIQLRSVWRVRRPSLTLVRSLPTTSFIGSTLSHL
jgi:hypothetical protein